MYIDPLVALALALVRIHGLHLYGQLTYKYSLCYPLRDVSISRSEASHGPAYHFPTYPSDLMRQLRGVPGPYLGDWIGYATEAPVND